MLKLHSPNKHIQLTFSMNTDCLSRKNSMFYRVTYGDQTVVSDSQLGLELVDEPEFQNSLDIQEVTYRSHRDEWKPLYGERNRIPDRYEEMTVRLREREGRKRRLDLVFRAYDEGVVFQYCIPRQPNVDEFVIKEEHTQFSFPLETEVYAEYWPEGEYERCKVRDINVQSERPLTAVISDQLFVCLHEAGMNDHAKMMLGPDEAQADILRAKLSGHIVCDGSYESPWRVMIIGTRPGELVEQNYLVLNVNDSCAIEDPSWIQPGKAIRETTLSTSGGKACIDFSAEHNLQYMLYDAGWYGNEFDEKADATTVSLDPERIKNNPNHDGLDLEEVIRYADQHGIGVFVYVNRRALEKQVDEILPLFQKWGVKGIKFGFVNEGQQYWTKWLLDAIRKCAKYHILVDVHDFYRPTGFSRTYPNLLTVEGIRGNEHFPTARHNCTLPFTRFTAGPGDYTICYYSPRLENTHAHQLAMAVIVYSPLQLLFWYDKPADYEGEEEIAFFEHVPTVWDETKVVQGEIGEYVTIARCKEEEWFVGCITNEQARQLDIPLSFLEEGIRYTAEIYADGSCDRSKSKTGVEKNMMEVDARTVLSVSLLARGGQAIRIYPFS